MLEDLNVSGMLKNHHLAQAIADVGFHEFRRQMAYKGKWYGCEVRLADRFYPSSKRCSGCGQVKPDLGLGEREYRCGYCGPRLLPCYGVHDAIRFGQCARACLGDNPSQTLAAWGKRGPRSQAEDRWGWQDGDWRHSSCFTPSVLCCT